MKNTNSKSSNNGLFILVVIILLLASFVVWQLYFKVNEQPSVAAPGKENIPEGYEWVEESEFGYLYPVGWPSAMYESKPIDTAVLQTVQHPPLLYDKELDVWVIAENTEDFKEGDIYNGLAVARRERGFTVYEAGFADEECGFSLYVFPSNDDLIQFRLPTFCFDAEQAETSEETILFTEEEFNREQEVLFSITIAGI